MERVFTHNYHYSFKSTHRSCNYHSNDGKSFSLESRSFRVVLNSFFLTVVEVGHCLRRAFVAIRKLSL